MRPGTMLLGVAMLTASAVGARAEVVAGDVVVGPEHADGYQLARQVLPASGGTAGLAASRIVFLNKGGITLTPGVNDARTNRSTIPKQQVTIPPWNPPAATWTATVSCLRDIFAPYDITLTETDPGNVPHIEAVFGGAPGQLGQPSNLAGVSPFTTDCAVIENSIVFTFASTIADNPQRICEVQAQEIAHSYGLDHVLLASDIMTYEPYDGRRWFQNREASCGEDNARPCGLNGSVCRQKQNSVSLLIERLGLKRPANDLVAPTIGMTFPANGQVVPPTFDVKFTANDNTKVSMVSLYIDGVASGTAVVAPYEITASGLTQGTHKLRLVATDGANEKSTEITVTVRGGEDDVVGGCAAGGGGGGGGATGIGLLLALGALVLRRRRR